MRTIFASSGESVVLDVTITDAQGASLSTFTFEYGWGSLSAIPATWLVPSAVDTTTAGKAVLSLTADNTVLAGSYFLWAKVTDANGHVEFVRVSNEEVTIV